MAGVILPGRKQRKSSRVESMEWLESELVIRIQVPGQAGLLSVILDGYELNELIERVRK